MSGDRSQKIFDATPSRKARAKREGNSVRSAEVGSIASFGAALAAACAVAPLVVPLAVQALRELCAHPALDARTLPSSLIVLAALAVVPAVAAALAGIAAGFAQAGTLHVRMPRPEFKRLDPIAGLKRLAGGEALVAALRALAAFTVVTIAVRPVLADAFARAMTLGNPLALGALVATAARSALWAAVAVGALFAAVDYVLARRRWLRELKMTLDEMRRDHKENDGDPQTRARRKSAHRALLRDAVARTKDASFVIVNPTHIAIAVRYAPPEVPVPEILVRAADDVAARVKAIAREHGVPIVENVPLARLLYAQGEAGHAIPCETFVAVAQLIAELSGAGALR